MNFEEQKGEPIDDDYDLEDDSGSGSGDEGTERGETIHNSGDRT
jgi:hypothetical protein